MLKHARQQTGTKNKRQPVQRQRERRMLEPTTFRHSNRTKAPRSEEYNI